MQPNENADRIVREHVAWSMAAGLVPLPMADIAVVSAVQLDMLSKLATCFGVRFSMLDARSLVTALVGGGVARLGANLLKLVPGAGSVVGGLSMSIMSGASTYAVAQVAMNEFAAGGNLSTIDMDAARSLYKRAFEQGKGYAADVRGGNGEDGSAERQDVFEKLERLGRLKAEGLLTDDEFKLQKQKLLERL